MPSLVGGAGRPWWSRHDKIMHLDAERISEVGWGEKGGVHGLKQKTEIALKICNYVHQQRKKFFENFPNPKRIFEKNHLMGMI